ncbi:MAG: hypothetical protein ACI8P9_000698 [Parasphingorhabdus sp.]|jgi:hypothetical protein
MSIDRLVIGLSGTTILLSLFLTVYHHPNWFWFTALVGINLLLSAFTRFCLMAKVLRGLGFGSSVIFK